MLLLMLKLCTHPTDCPVSQVAPGFGGDHLAQKHGTQGLACRLLHGEGPIMAICPPSEECNRTLFFIPETWRLQSLHNATRPCAELEKSCAGMGLSPLAQQGNPSHSQSCGPCLAACLQRSRLTCTAMHFGVTPCLPA